MKTLKTWTLLQLPVLPVSTLPVHLYLLPLVYLFSTTLYLCPSIGAPTTCVICFPLPVSLSPYYFCPPAVCAPTTCTPIACLPIVCATCVPTTYLPIPCATCAPPLPVPLLICPLPVLPVPPLPLYPRYLFANRPCYLCPHYLCAGGDRRRHGQRSHEAREPQK